MLAALPGVFAQADVDPYIQACGEDPGPFCTWVYRQTEIVWLSTLAGRVIPTILQIVLILVVAWLLNRIVRRLIRRFVNSLQEQGMERLSALRARGPVAATHPLDIARATMRTKTIAGVLRSIATVAIWTTALVMVLGTVGINLGPLVAGAGIAGVALGFGAQSLVKDFLSGVFMLLEDQYGVGDIVDLGEATGTVEGITLRTTRVRDVEGVVWHVPNGQINRVGNMSQQWSRALVDVSVAYDTDLDHAQRVIKRVADEVWNDPELGVLVLDEPEVWGVERIGPDDIVIRLVVKTAPQQQWRIARELRARLKEAFDAEGIVIPTPQRTVWMHHVDGEEGGRPPERPREAPAQQRRQHRAEGAPASRPTEEPASGPAPDDAPTRALTDEAPPRRSDDGWLPPAT